MNDATYYTVSSYWILSSLFAILGNGFIILISTSVFTSFSKWSLQIDKITVTFILYLSIMDFLYGASLLAIVINDTLLLRGDRGKVLLGGDMEINVHVMLLHYGTFNIVLNSINVMSWTANILLILLITLHRVGEYIDSDRWS